MSSHPCRAYTVIGLAQLVLILIKSFFLDKEIEQMKKKRRNVLIVTGIAILGWIGFLYMNAGAFHAGYSSPFVPENNVIVVAEYGADIEQHGQEMEYPESNTTGYQPEEENPEPYYEQYGDPESGEPADPEQEVPEEEGAPEEGYEPPSEEMPNNEPEIPQG
jgi:hypothetical protein